MDIKSYVRAARLRTLPLSISGIIVGSLLAKSHGFFDWTIFLFSVFTTISLQVLSNFSNDYGDGVKGTDAHRIGEERMVSSGMISPKQMKLAIIVVSVLVVLSIIALIYSAFGRDHLTYSVLFLLLGIYSMIAAIKYTVGRFAYGYNGLGDLSVFVFFGLVSVLGTYFLFTKQMHLTVLLPAFSIGLLSVSVLNLNNMRDYQNDKRSGKHTLVVKLGSAASKRYHYCLFFLSLIFAVSYVLIDYSRPVQWIFLITYIPLVRHVVFVARNNEASKLDGELKKVALTTFLFALLFGFGQIL